MSNYLPGFEPEQPAFRPKNRGTDAFFFALRPTSEAVAKALAAAHALQRAHGIQGKMLKGENLHVTLFPLGEYDGMPDGLAPAASAIAQNIRAAAIEARFDMAMSFGKDGKAQLVLCGSDTSAIAQLQMQFGRAFRHIIKGGTQKTPHMTLIYRDRVIAKQPIDPVCWSAGEFVLIHSFVGKGRHEVLNRWPLKDIT